jgi:hypothetical protein
MTTYNAGQDSGEEAQNESETSGSVIEVIQLLLKVLHQILQDRGQNRWAVEKASPIKHNSQHKNGRHHYYTVPDQHIASTSLLVSAASGYL